MKNNIFLFLISACLNIMFPFKSSSQGIKKLGEIIKAKTEQKVLTKFEEKTENVLNNITSNNRLEKENKAGGIGTDRKTGVNTRIKDTIEYKTAYKSKFDFIPGEKILFLEDFAAETIGDFPSKWKTNGSGEVVTVDGFEEKWLMLQPKSVFVLNDLLKLPENFTIQFDLICSAPFNWSSGSIFFAIADVKNPESYFNTSSHTLNNDKNIAFWLDMHPDASKSKSKGYGHYNMYNTSANNLVAANLEITGFQDIKEKLPLKVSVWKQKQRLRIYLNENKIVDLPRILPAEMNVNSLVWKTENNLENDKYFISNLRVAIGNPDTRNKLLTVGKLVTSGILFAVNSDVIKPESYGVLKEIAGILKENEGINITIVGHTDSDGDEAKNLELSKKRAASVKNFLTTEFKITPERIETDGKGEIAPLVPNTNAINKANNRRVEFIKTN